METVSSAEFQKHLGYYQDRALVEPVILTRNGRERLVTPFRQGIQTAQAS